MKKLIFYFYIGKNWETNKANLAHFICLKHYNKVFDEVEIFLSVDDRNDEVNLKKAREIFLSIFENPKSISFHVMDNTQYRESLMVKERIIDRLGEDDLVFTGHNKGFTDITNPNYAEHFVLTWIVGCYYLSLENIKEVEDCLYYDPTALSFGSFLAQLKSPEGQEMKQLGKYKWYYVGNFFWINSKKLKNYNDRNKVIPPLLGDRYYAENILANLFPLNIQGQATFAGSKNFSYYIKYDDSFLNICDLISVVYKNDSDAIYSMVNEVTEEINKQLA